MSSQLNLPSRGNIVAQFNHLNFLLSYVYTEERHLFPLIDLLLHNIVVDQKQPLTFTKDDTRERRDVTERLAADFMRKYGETLWAELKLWEAVKDSVKVALVGFLEQLFDVDGQEWAGKDKENVNVLVEMLKVDAATAEKIRVKEGTKAAVGKDPVEELEKEKEMELEREKLERERLD